MLFLCMGWAGLAGLGFNVVSLLGLGWASWPWLQCCFSVWAELKPNAGFGAILDTAGTQPSQFDSYRKLAVKSGALQHRSLRLIIKPSSQKEMSENRSVYNVEKPSRQG